MNKKQLSGKITVVVGGGSAMGLGIVRTLLMENATVIVPSSNAHEIDRLIANTRDLASGGLITLPTDMIDYAKAADISENIRQRFRKIDMVVAVFDNDCSSVPLIETDIRDWQKIMDDCISAHFIAGRLALHLMKEQGSGTFITVCDADTILDRPNSPLARIATKSQVELSLIFSEEIADCNINYYHLTPGPGLITPEMIGDHIIKLYQGKVPDPQKLFQHFLGRPLPSHHTH